MQSEIEAFEIGDYYTEYVSAFGPPHPDQVVETKFLSAVTVPVATYEPLIRDELVRSQPLSGLQIEALILACQRHLQHIDNGVRAGFFIGDGAGVGKGRTVAGLIWENWHHGRKKTLWVSTGSDLMFDARRDLNDVGARCIEMHLLSKLGYSKSKTDGVKEGVIFSTYRSLIASPRKGIRTRMQQLVEWCGDGFDGLIIFDECHKAKNLVPKKGRQPTRTGEAVRDIQAQLPEARVVYCSATGASEPRNMAYMVRLGLWGDGTYFPDFGEFLGALEKGGVGALELVAMDMKARGMYICRTLSYKGAEFETIEAKLDKEMKDAYEKASDVWVCLYEKLKSAISLLSEKPNTKNLWSLYWSSHQRFFRQLCISAKVPTAVELSKKALREDKCVVIGLQSTGESWTKKARSKHGSNLVEYTSGPRELLLNFVQDYYPLPKKPEILPAASVPESDHEPEGDEHVPRGTNTNELQKSYNTALKSKEKILMAIHALDLPNNPLDDIIEQLGGHDQVAEITGRKGSFVGKPIGGVIYEKRNTENVTAEMVNITEKKLFMDGKKLVAIISEAGSAGISLQADRSAKNQKRRVHLTLELPWSADRAIQQFGRTHRSNQVSVPEYRLLFTHLGGERRFASAVAKRLESLGALTQGDRRAGHSLSAYNYDSAYGKQALMDMYIEIMGQGGTLPLVPQGCSSDTPDTIKDFISKAKYALASVGIFESTINDDKHDVEQFLNRILGIAPEFQNRIFGLFVGNLDLLVGKSSIESNLDTDIVYLKSEVILKTEKKVYVDQKSGASTVLFTYEVSSKEVNVLSGVILPIWGNIKMALSKQVREIDKRPRIVHVETESDGIRRVGLLIPNAAVKTVLQDLTEVIKLVD